MPGIALLADVLAEMQPLDIIVMADEGRVSSGIQAVTSGSIGHCAVVESVRPDIGDVRLVEALWPRVRRTWLSERITDYAKCDRGRVF